MAGDTRSTVALLASLLLLSSLPLLSGADTGDVVFSIEEESAQANQWYESGDFVQITALFTNTGSLTSIQNDPSCGVVLQVYDAQETMFIDESSACRDQTQSIDLAEGETYSFEPLTWNLQGDDGEFVETNIVKYVQVHFRDNPNSPRHEGGFFFLRFGDRSSRYQKVTYFYEK